VKRRDFITLVGGAATWPLAAQAQQAERLPTIGFLGAGTLSTYSPWAAAFTQRLRELGWIEGGNIAIEYRWAEGRNERYTKIATEFTQLKVDVIVTTGTAAVIAAKQATASIPIVFTSAGDPVATGLVASLAQPGRQRHRVVEPVARCCRQAARILARNRSQSSSIGNLDQHRDSHWCRGDSAASGCCPSGRH
jgi:hypothetical protein